MKKISKKTKALALSTVALSSVAIAYANNEISKTASEDSLESSLLVEKIDKDTVKLSVDNIEKSVKAFQLSVKIDGNVNFTENIKWLTKLESSPESELKSLDSNSKINTNYRLSEDKKSLDIVVTSEETLLKQGSKLEICEIDVSKLNSSNFTYKIVPNNDNIVAFKYIDHNNKQIEVANIGYDGSLDLSINSAPIIELIDGENIDKNNNRITIKQGSQFDSKAVVNLIDEDEELNKDNLIIRGIVKTNNPGSYNLDYEITDSLGEKATLTVTVIVEPITWEGAPTINGVLNKIEIYTDEEFDPLNPNGEKITATDAMGNTIDEIKISGDFDSKVPGKYKIIYTATDRFDNTTTEETTLIVKSKSGINGVDIGGGDPTSENNPLSVIVTGDKDNLNELLNKMRDDYEVKRVGEPVIDTERNEAIYTIKINRKSGLLKRLFARSESTTLYYINIAVPNNSEFKSLLNDIPKDGNDTINPPSSGGGSTGGGSITPSVPQTSITKLIGEDRYETAVKISKEGWKSANTVIIVNGNDNHLVDGLTATPLASAKNAPILLSNNKELPKFTIDEIKRLNPSNVIVIGGETSIPNSIINEVKNINSNIKVSRIGGQTRYETSLNIAKELDKLNNITKIYVGAGYGEADSLSISPVAGREKAPIILTEKDGLDKSTYDYIKSQNVVDGYLIGGEARISDKAMKQINDVVSKDISGNRISGAERQDTNAKIIEKFYTNTDLASVAVAKDYDLVDALAVGPLAAKKDMPVVLATNSLSKSQESILTKKKSSKIYETGGGIKSSVVDKLISLLSK